MRLLVLVLASSLFLSCDHQTPETSKRYKTIVLKSTGKIEVAPDQASFYIQLNCLKSAINQSKECLVEKSNTITQQLKDLGILEKDLFTTSIDMRREYTWRNNSRVFLGYQSSTQIKVTVNDIDRLSTIYTALLEKKDLSLTRLSYHHSNIDSLKNKAYLLGLKKANVLADQILLQLPEDEKEIIQISNEKIESFSSKPFYATRHDVVIEETETVQNRSVAINPGMISVNATLFVEYQID